jgi:diguanylate cyclase (GGDEF)-like protein
VAGGQTIGVLSPFLGGPYYGPIIAGVARSARHHRARVVAVQTLDAGCENADIGGPPPFHHQIAWRYLSGIVVVSSAVDAAHLVAARAAGISLVAIGDQFDGLDCPTILADNHRGAWEATEHLLSHGHRDIAFVGYGGSPDVRQRLEGYRAALRAHGIVPDPRLHYEAMNNLTVGPEATGEMFAANIPFTAVIAGTDANAIELIRILRDAGHEVPGRVAVIGFDDGEAARYCLPRLSSVRQPLGDLGVVAYDLLSAQLDGKTNPTGPHFLPTELSIRESCGCTSEASGRAPTASGWTADSARTTLAQCLADTIGLDQVPKSGATPIADRVDTAAAVIIETIEAAANGHPHRCDTQIRQAFDSLELTSPLVNLDSALHAVRGFAAEAANRSDRPAAASDVERHVQKLILEFAEARARGQYANSAYYRQALSTQYVVSMDLLRSHEQNPRTLGWLARTGAAGGCLAQWRSVSDSTAVDAGLDIVGTYLRDRENVPTTPTTTTASEFPPRELAALTDQVDDSMVFVIPVRSRVSDWGLLAVVETIESAVPSGRETINQWSALLNVALDYESVMASLRDQEARLRRAAMFDELTSLPNRALFLDRLRHALQRMKRQSDYNFAVLFFDLDDFKIINDSMGHTAGDKLLVQVAHRIRNTLREVDTVARFGGDEFLILIDDVMSYGSPMQIAERLHSSLATPFRVERQELVLTASVGIALSSKRYQSAEEMLRDADIAMYTAKTREKGSHALFDVTMHAAAVDRMRTESELRRALDHDEFEVHYQPIVDLRTGRTASFEALIRWRHPDRGLLFPDSFLGVAEDSGLMTKLGGWILGESCRQLATWNSAGRFHNPIRMSVNVSHGQFWHGGLVDDLDECLRTTHLDPRNVVLEITEGVIMHNAELACKILGDLHDRGVELHIDDFGTGYSSLEALHRLPIDALKIDRSFVARLGIDPRSREFVKTIVLMGTNLGMELIAEGVESRVHRDHLRTLGTTYGQGYWFSKPVPGQVAGGLIGFLPKAGSSEGASEGAD